MPNRPDGNRQDNRQRGNAAQLLEKYKSLARDAQLAGDRVQTEYYLQYADHYFRVLEDGRSRFEEQNQRRARQDDEDEEGEDVAVDQDSGDDEGEEDARPPRRERAPQRERADRGDRGERPQRGDREDRPRRERAPAAAEGEERIPLGVLPPAIGVTADDGEEEAPRPRRRVRKPRDEDGEDIAPAA